MTYQHTITGIIRHHECDMHGELKLHALLDRLQDAAAEHAAKLNVGMDELASLQLIWVLSRLQITLHRPLLLGEELTVITYPSGVERIFAHRCYDLRINGERVGCAGSFWLPVSTTNNRPVNAKKVLPPEIMELPDVEKFFPGMDKLPDDCPEFCASRTVNAGDIDLNRHLNNAVYSRWITDILGEKLCAGAVRISDIQINFLSSGMPGDKIRLRAALNEEGKFSAAGEKSDGTLVFQAAGKAVILRD
ncbi:MAG: hypothetical protein IKC82_07170 [Lentisphaeria bacterium]|nr:hypothetical protein [Lentisphaeria bacterium]